MSALTWEGEDGHLFRLTCSVVLWEGRDTANKYRLHVWKVLAVYGSYWVCYSPRWHVLSGSTLLRLQGALQGYCPKWVLHFMHFPGLSGSHSQVLCKGTDPDGMWVLCPSQAWTAQETGCLVSSQSQMCFVSPLGSLSQDMTILSDINRPESQEDMVSNWEPVHSLVEDAVSWAEIAAATCLLALAVACPPLFLWNFPLRTLQFLGLNLNL